MTTTMRSDLSPIPPITDPLGRYWDQPEREAIEIDDTHALMAERTFKQLADYSCSVPSGVYEGKMWKRRRDYYDERQGWLLVWYGESTVGPGYCSNNFREILVERDQPSTGTVA